jgi:hypothetical protein
VASFGHFVASALCQIASAVLGDQRPDLRPVSSNLAASVMMCSAIK